MGGKSSKIFLKFNIGSDCIEENKIQEGGIEKPEEIKVVKVSGKWANSAEKADHLPDNDIKEDNDAKGGAKHAEPEK